MEQDLRIRLERVSAWCGFVLLVGFVAAFAVASCCALPILLTSAGIGVAWLSGIAVTAAPFRTPLLIAGALFLLSGAALLGRQQAAASRCGPDGVCTPSAMRILTFTGLLVGIVLLYLGYHYV